ncbi:MAG TPA: S9 family peptidase [Gemmatimonadaceae bacterium]|nr:S9 family peptidase [Gemmatimonadaceae bacterium]
MRSRPVSRWRSFAIALVALITAAGTVRAQEKTRFTSLQDALRASAVLFGRSGPQNVNWIDGGARFSYDVRDPQSGQPVIRALDPGTGRDTLLFSPQGLTFPGSTEPFEYDSFQWAHDSKHLVFQTHFKPLYRRSGTSDYYVYTLADHSLQLATRGARTAELSPDGTMLGFERDGDMYVTDLTRSQETRLTSDASEHVFNGHFDWVYEEEFGMAQAWNWSPDSRHIAYWQVDESAEPEVQLTDFAGRHPDWDVIRIPQPGDSNPTVRIGVVDVRSHKRTWLDTGERGEFYIPRIYWTSRADTLAVITLNRRQNVMTLYFFDVNTGGRRQVMRDSSSTWIDVYDFYAGVQDMMTFPAGMHEFFWLSDRDGWQHIYRYDYSGKLINQVTKGRWIAARIEGIDPTSRTIFYTSTQQSPLERQLYAVSFDGSHTRRLTEPAGRHAIDMSPNTRYYIDRWSSVHEPRQVELWATGGKKLRTLEDNAATTRWLATHAYSPAEPFSFTTSDSVRIDAAMIRPVPFDSTRRYPVVLSIYGGPGSQQVYDEFAASTWEQWLAQEGYIVVHVNNRGTNNYGSAFMKVVYRELGKWESRDFAETARYLATLPYVDGSRVAIMGTSYGGYATVTAMERYPDVFSVGIANSPVTDWRLYDTIYTERYMGLLGENAAGYDSSSAVLRAPALSGHLLLIHSMMDDNVHPQNTMQLLTALTNAGHDVDLRIYPPGRHGAAYNGQSAMLIRQATDAYLARYLKGDAAATTRAPAEAGAQ